MGPDYANYDLTQLRQALGSIDFARFPERVAEIKTRMAALEQAEHLPTVPAGSSSPGRPLGLQILRRAGAVLIAICLIDIATTFYFILNGQSYSFKLNIGALIAGVLLWNGGLRTASLIRWVACAMLPATVLMGLGFLAMQPLDLTVTEVRLYPGASFIATAFVIGYTVLLIWLFRELGRAPVLAARCGRATVARHAHPVRTGRHRIDCRHHVDGVSAGRRAGRSRRGDGGGEAGRRLSIPHQFDECYFQQWRHCGHRLGRRLEFEIGNQRAAGLAGIIRIGIQSWRKYIEYSRCPGR